MSNTPQDRNVAQFVKYLEHAVPNFDWELSPADVGLGLITIGNAIAGMAEDGLSEAEVIDQLDQRTQFANSMTAAHFGGAEANGPDNA